MFNRSRMRRSRSSGARALDDGSGLIFPSKYKPGHPLSDVALMNLVKRLGYAERTTAHGFRATFRTWATECTDATVRAKKLSTAHKVGDDIEEAYDRAIVLDPRRELMQRWACHVMGHSYTPSAPPLLGPLPQATATEQLGLFDLP